MKLSFLAVALGAFLLPPLHAEDTPVAQLKTFSTVGKQLNPLSVEKEAELFSHEGKGCLTHVWFGGQFKDSAYTRIRVYVDGETPGTGNNNGFMEGCIRAYFDGSKEPTLLSSGFEDYFLGTYYFNRGRYATAIAGVTHLDLPASEVSTYRFHDADPIFFQNGFKLTARCGEQVNGKTIWDPPATVYTTYAWLYQW